MTISLTHDKLKTQTKFANDLTIEKRYD